jgi:hypothetical protein
MKNFEQPETAEFIVHSVLIENRYMVVRSFIDVWITDKMTPEIYDIYFDIFLSGSSARQTAPIHVSAWEQHSRILDFIYNCLTRSLKFENEKERVKSYLLDCDHRNVPAIFDLITWTENLDQILDSVRNNFGLEFVINIFSHKIESGSSDNLNLFLYISQHGGNLPGLLTWIRKNFTDVELLKELIFSVNPNNNLGILHYAFRSYSNQDLSNLLEALTNWDLDLVRQLFLMQDEFNQIFLFNYAHNSNFDTDFLIKILSQIKMDFGFDNERFLSDIIFNKNDLNRTILSHFCLNSRNFELLKILEWLNDTFELEYLKLLLLHRDNEQNSIIFHFLSNNQNSIASFLDILNYFKVKLSLDENFIKTEYILKNNKFNENILQLILLRSENLKQFNDFLQQFGISDSELGSSLVHSETLLFQIAQKSEEDQEKYLDFLKEKFGQDFLAELISDRSLIDLCLHPNRFNEFGSSIFKYLNFIKRNFGIDFLKKLISYTSGHNQTFLFYLHSTIDANLLKIIKYLMENFETDREYLQQFLLTANEDGDTFLNFYFSQSFVYRTLAIIRELFEMIKDQFGLSFLKTLLLMRNHQNQNFYQTLLLNEYDGGVKRALQLLEILLEVVGRDEGFFVEFTKQEEIPDQIKEFLRSNFGGSSILKSIETSKN